MSKLIIKVEKVSKKYILNAIGTGTLRNDLNRWWAGIRGKEDPLSIVDENINSNTNKKNIYKVNKISVFCSQG